MRSSLQLGLAGESKLRLRRDSTELYTPSLASATEIGLHSILVPGLGTVATTGNTMENSRYCDVRAFASDVLVTSSDSLFGIGEGST